MNQLRQQNASELVETADAVTTGTSGAGRLIVKDFVMLGAGILTMADAAKTYVRRSA